MCSAPPGLLDFHHVFDRADGVARLAGFGRFFDRCLGLPARLFVNALRWPSCSTRRSVNAQTRASTRSGEIPCRGAIKIGRKAAHLILELRKRSDVVHAPLLVQCGDRLRPHHLAARRAHGGERDTRIDHAKGRRDHLAPVVDLLVLRSAQALRLIGAVGLHATPPRFIRAPAAAAVSRWRVPA